MVVLRNFLAMLFHSQIFCLDGHPQIENVFLFVCVRRKKAVRKFKERRKETDKQKGSCLECEMLKQHMK